MTEQPTKPARFRSVAYPPHTITTSFDFCLKIHQSFGNLNYQTRDDISKALGIPVGTILSNLSAATQYDLLDVKNLEGYRITELFKSIYKPIDENEKRDAKIKCLKSPELYKKLIQKYEGSQLPAVNGLAILLYRQYKVSEEASLKAAKIFIKNLEELQVIDTDNILRLASTGIEIEQDDDEEKTSSPEAFLAELQESPFYAKLKTAGGQVINFSNQEAPPIPIFLSDNRVAKLLLPADFTDADLDAVIRIATVYKKG